jgi:hypothetical protein
MTTSINIIGEDVYRFNNAQGKLDWSLPASQALAQRIMDKIDPKAINVRFVQQGDSLGRVAEGLSGRSIKRVEEGGEGWDKVDVIYRGTSSQIQEQQKDNPSRLLVTANKIYPGQYVCLRDGRVIVAFKLDELLS